MSITSVKSGTEPRTADAGRVQAASDPRALQAEMTAAVLAGHGLSAVARLAADATGAPVAIVMPRLAAAVCSDEAGPADVLSALTDWVTQRALGRPAAVPRSVVEQRPIHFQEALAGVVALLETGRPPAELASQYLDGTAVAALIELAVQDAREETEHRVRGSFLEGLRAREQLSGAEVARRASRLGCDLSGGGIVLCLDVISERFHLVLATIAAEHPSALAQQLDGIEVDARPRVYAVLPTLAGGDIAATEASARQLAERLRRHAIVGISSCRAYPAELGDAVREAEMMLEVLRYSQDSAVAEIDGNGTYKLLFRMLASHPEEVRAFYESTIAAVVRYDDRYSSELVRTLRAYFDANCNMNATATALFAHRHTVAYRLDRIHELTGLDPMLTEHRERLGLGLKIHRIVVPLAGDSAP
ncbi:MAG: helix-turn-helix domain-containing protein [Solirubrobacteraceae bacterium]